MTRQVSQQEVNEILWRACDTFRGTLDAADYKDYILVMLFLKYISDVWRDHFEQYKKQYGDDEERIRRRLQRERFILPYVEVKDGDEVVDRFLADYYSLHERREAPNLGELINVVLEYLEMANKAKLTNVFRNVDFNSESRLGNTKKRNHILQHLLTDFADARLDLRPSRIGNLDVIGNAYEYLIGKFAAGAGKKAGEYYTPPEVSILIAKLVDPKPGERICDPACGSGSLLLKCAQEVGSDNYSLYGQEAISGTWSLCAMNMFLHNINSARVEWADTLLEPKLIENDDLMKFDVVVANPPFSLDKWGADKAGEEARKYNRWHRGVPPKSKADYAFISHMVETMAEQGSRMGVVVPHGVLFRSGAEGKIRKSLIEENMLDAVIALPPNLFFGTGIPAAVLIFRRDRGQRSSVLFIDASREYDIGKNQNKIRVGVEVKKIAETYKAYQSVDKYACLVNGQDLQKNDCNLNVSHYVDSYEEAQDMDIDAVLKHIHDLEDELGKVKGDMAHTLTELGL
ncbi:MAG: type I restriction-modification system subunit M [Gammaproteobacteria bacterium]|nr:type I restriction-modification system subunit M [Gammaproteobacteria bacterium]